MVTAFLSARTDGAAKVSQVSGAYRSDIKTGCGWYSTSCCRRRAAASPWPCLWQRRHAWCQVGARRPLAACLVCLMRSGAGVARCCLQTLPPCCMQAFVVAKRGQPKLRACACSGWGSAPSMALAPFSRLGRTALASIASIVAAGLAAAVLAFLSDSPILLQPLQAIRQKELILIV